MPQAEASSPLKPPRRRRKSRPAFEVPAEAGLQEAPVGWVYRADEESEEPVRRVAPAHPLEMVATGLTLVGAGTAGVLSLAALGLITAAASHRQRNLLAPPLIRN